MLYNFICPFIRFVDIYNSVSLEFGVPCGGEDVDMIKGAMRLTLAEGDEPFITLGSDENEPPYRGEIVYKDDEGAICRCWNWRESVRTMLTEDIHKAIFVIESVDGFNGAIIGEVLDVLRQRITDFLGGNVETALLTRDNSGYISLFLSNHERNIIISSKSCTMNTMGSNIIKNCRCVVRNRYYKP